MQPIVMAAALVTLVAPAAAEPAYDVAYYEQLTRLGLEREAFLYAFK
jgi:hypothetical protein